MVWPCRTHSNSWVLIKMRDNACPGKIRWSTLKYFLKLYFTAHRVFYYLFFVNFKALYFKVHNSYLIILPAFYSNYKIFSFPLYKWGNWLITVKWFAPYHKATYSSMEPKSLDSRSLPFRLFWTNVHSDITWLLFKKLNKLWNVLQIQNTQNVIFKKCLTNSHEN